MTTFSTAKRLAKETLLGFAALILVWSLAWLGKSTLDTRWEWIASGAGSAVFWLSAKLLIWIVPACWWVRRSGRAFGAVVNLAGWRRWSLWGGGVGLAIALTAVIPKSLRGALLLPTTFDAGTINVLLISPLCEEFLIRGAVLGNLIPAWGFARANVISAACFAMLHLPGWYMMGSIEANLTRPVGGAFSIFLLGLCFGWATRKGGSFLAGSVAHFLNNLFA